MGKVLNVNARRVFCLRLPRDVVVVSRDIPFFRARLEAFAVLTYNDWLLECERKKVFEK
jgi:hypothetical protein